MVFCSDLSDASRIARASISWRSRLFSAGSASLALVCPVEDLYPEAGHSLSFVQSGFDEREFSSRHRDLVPAPGKLPHPCHLSNLQVEVPC